MNNSFLEKVTILVVEDSATDRTILVDAIKRYFPKIIEVSNGEDACEIFKNNKDIDIIISDINMPGISGIDFLKFVRQRDTNIPFIFTTSQLNTNTIMEAINLNVSSYLPKPVDLILLLQKIDFLCEQKFYEVSFIKKKKEIKRYMEAVDKVALIFKMNDNGKILYMNNAMKDVSEYNEEDLKDLNFNNIIHPDIPQKYITETWNYIKEDKLWKGNTKFITKNKDTFYVNNTVFKIDNEKEEYITIAFLTTKENLEKRDFHKKILLRFQEINKKEFEYKETIKQLYQEQKKYKNLYESNIELINTLKNKNKSKERQLSHYEMQGDNITQKYNDFMSSKKEEIDNYIKSLKIEKQRNEIAKIKEEEMTDLVESLNAKCENLENEIKIKNSRIKNLIDIVSDEKKININEL